MQWVKNCDESAGEILDVGNYADLMKKKKKKKLLLKYREIKKVGKNRTRGKKNQMMNPQQKMLKSGMSMF